MYYTIVQVPDKYQSIIKRLIQNGYISYEGSFEYPLSEEMLMLLLIMARLGLF